MTTCTLNNVIVERNEFRQGKGGLFNV